MSARAAAALSVIERNSDRMVMHSLNSRGDEGTPNAASNVALGGTSYHQGGPEATVSQLLKAKVSLDNSTTKDTVQLCGGARGLGQ